MMTYKQINDLKDKFNERTELRCHDCGNLAKITLHCGKRYYLYIRCCHCGNELGYKYYIDNLSNSDISEYILLKQMDMMSEIWIKQL